MQGTTDLMAPYDSYFAVISKQTSCKIDTVYRVGRDP